MPLDGTLSMPLLGAQRRSRSEQARLRAAFDQNYAGVWRFLRRMGVGADRADDAAAHVFLVAVEAFARVVEGSERAFLYGTAVRVAHGIRRKTQREVPDAAVDAGPSPIPPPDQLADQKRSREVLDRIVASLEPDVRAVFVLAELEGFTTPEIAELLQVPLGTAASRLRRARERFQRAVRETYGEEP